MTRQYTNLNVGKQNEKRTNIDEYLMWQLLFKQSDTNTTKL